MVESESITDQDSQRKPIKERFWIQNSSEWLITIVFGVIGAIIFLAISSIQLPYLAISLFKLGFMPALAIVAVVGAIRGPVAGFLCGYIGSILTDVIWNGYVVAFSSYSFAIGVLGLVVGLTQYDFTNGKSLAKLSILSLIGLVFAMLLTAVFGLLIEELATLAVIGFQILGLVSQGIPTVVLLTPLFARLWHIFMVRFLPQYL